LLCQQEFFHVLIELKLFEPLGTGTTTPTESKQHRVRLKKKSQKFDCGKSKIQRGKWLRGRDLNPRPSGYEPDELPGCSTPLFIYGDKSGQSKLKKQF
jgi:hypothetical protein